MIRKHDDLVGSMIHDIAHLIRLKIDDRLKPFRLTRSKWLALGVIDSNPGLAQTELASRLELGNAATGRLVDRLVERGFVTRSPDADDRRAYNLEITADARSLLAQLQPIGDSLREEVLADIEEEDRRAMERGLKAIKTKLRATANSALAVTAMNGQTFESIVGQIYCFA